MTPSDSRDDDDDDDDDDLLAAYSDLANSLLGLNLSSCNHTTPANLAIAVTSRSLSHDLSYDSEACNQSVDSALGDVSKCLVSK